MTVPLPSAAAQEVVLVFCNAPDVETARGIARRLVDDGMAACVNVGAPILSIYRWKGEVESADEIPLCIKTTAARQRAVQEAIARLHPYDVPEIVVVPVIEGLPAYLDWVRQETKN